MQLTRDNPATQRRSSQRLLYTPLVRWLWGRLMYWHFVLFRRWRYSQPLLEQVAGTPLLVLPQVFNPKLMRTGSELAQQLDRHVIAPDASVLDMGTGSGIGAVFAAKYARRVVAVDINAEAVRCARINAMLNQVDERVEVHYGDLFAPLGGERFDLVLFNPPFFRGTARDALGHAWRSNDTVERFAAGLRAHLTPGGYALVLLSTDGETPAFLQAFESHGFSISIFHERDLINERLTIYKIRQD